MTEELIKFLQNEDNQNLLNQNTKESWEEIYKRVSRLWVIGPSYGEFTELILKAGINDPARIMERIPRRYLYDSSIDSYQIPSNVLSIGDSAFFGCNNLTTISIPDSVTHIYDGAFSNCENLVDVIVGNNVSVIDSYAFSHCKKLKSVSIPDSVTRIGYGAFRGCKNLVDIVLPSQISIIAADTFYDCRSLTSVVIPASVTMISEDAFYGCISLQKINFKGTKMKATSLFSKVDTANTAIKQIVCVDGVIEL